MASNSKNWAHFERLVTAIHQAADEGAQVCWDDTINGRQFDVTIRFRRGLYDYLTVIECKDYSNPVPVEKVEAFVTKSRDVHAHHAVLASTAGFQRGAEEVAQRHNITLIHVTDSNDVDLSLFRARWTGVTDALHIERISIEYADGQVRALPEAANAMTYYVQKIVLACGADRMTLEDLVHCHAIWFHRGTRDEYLERVITCREGTAIVAPNDEEFPLEPVARIRIRAGVTQARVLTSPVKFETHLLVPGVTVKNVTTGEESEFDRHNLPIGLGTEFHVGSFYEQPNLSAFYYCDAITDKLATIYLVESFQFGNLIQVVYTTDIKYAKFYVPVSDAAVLARLRRRLARMKRVTS